MPNLILASGSAFKRQLMARLDVPFEAIDADIDERAHHHTAPLELARALARAKALALRSTHPEAAILGCDQVISLGSEVLHKPGDHARACAQLRRLQGRTHDLICAICLSMPTGELFEAHAHYLMDMRPLSDVQIERYVSQDEPFGCAGSYKIEQNGVRLFRAMRGDDYTAIVGLPLTRVMDVLEDAGLLPTL